MNALKGMFKSASGSAVPMRITESPVPLAYTLSSFRWHTDTRPPRKAIVVHDYLSNSNAWQQKIHRRLGELPLHRFTLSDPLEIYAVDLRGHNSSQHLKWDQASEQYALACAADVAMLRSDVLRTEALIAGVGFGALVALCAALHAPDSFSSVSLFLSKAGQITACDTDSYGERAIACGVPPGTATLTALNDYVKKAVSNSVDRAVLLSNAEVTDGAARFRYSNEVLSLAPLSVSSAMSEAVFTKPVTAFLSSSDAMSAEEHEFLLQRCPNAKVLDLSKVRENSSLDMSDPASAMLISFEMLSQMSDQQ